MTVVKIEGSLAGDAAEAIAPHAQTIYGKPGGAWYALVEVTHVERVQPAPRSEKEPSVKLRITGLEMPTGGRQAEALASVREALHVQRTAAGTLDESGEITLHDRTLELTAGIISAEEAARLRVYLAEIDKRLRAVSHKHDLTANGARAEIRKIQSLADKALGRDIEDAEAGLDKAGA